MHRNKNRSTGTSILCSPASVNRGEGGRRETAHRMRRPRECERDVCISTLGLQDGRLLRLIVYSYCECVRRQLYHIVSVVIHVQGIKCRSHELWLHIMLLTLSDHDLFNNYYIYRITY